MNYWHGDYALSRAALELARVSGADSPPHMANISYSADAATLLASSKNWIKLLDPKTGHFRVKNSNGSFLNTFDEFAWGPEVCSENKLVTGLSYPVLLNVAWLHRSWAVAISS